MKKKRLSMKVHKYECGRKDKTMWLLPMRTMLRLYSGHMYPGINHHKWLKNQGHLVRWESVSPDETVIYVSHEWGRDDHADPKGVQIGVLCRTLKMLMKGEMHTFTLKSKQNTEAITSKEWVEKLQNRVYIWFDWFCVPSELPGQALNYVPAYMERSNIMLILAPGYRRQKQQGISDQKMQQMWTHLCYRTWRRNALCCFDFMCAYLHPLKSRLPTLLVKSSQEGGQEHISVYNARKLKIGECLFPCCKSNHKNSSSMHCLKSIAESLLRRMIRVRSSTEFERESKQSYAMARMLLVEAHWILRGLSKDIDAGIFQNLDKIVEEKDEEKMCPLAKLKDLLKWSNDYGKDEEWFDRYGIGIVFYAAVQNNYEAIQKLIQNLEDVMDTNIKKKSLLSCIPSGGVAEFGLIEGMTSLDAAMIYSSFEIVDVLLRAGINPFETNNTEKIDSFQFACCASRKDNVKMWLERFQGYNPKRKNALGLSALHMGARFGVGMVEFLVDTLQMSVCFERSLQYLSYKFLHIPTTNKNI